MGDISKPSLLYTKAVLFVVLGVLTSAAILMAHPSLRTAALLALAIWAFCRAYYFAFYVIGHYVDPSFRFAGLISVARYLLGDRRSGHTGSTDPPHR
jgi:hypothetical protein